MKFIKSNYPWLVAIILLTYYGYYIGKAKAVSWYDEHPAKAYLIIRQQPDGKKFDPCVVTVSFDSVLSILSNGDYELNQTQASVHNCKFQWVMDNPRLPK